MAFQKATKRQARLRLALIGPSGSGKTYTALRTATALGKRVAVIDSERGSASKYASLFDFDTMDLEHFAPKSYVAAIHEAEKAGYDVLVIDSLSHAWMGKGGALEMVDAAAARNRGDKFSGWRDVTPEHNSLVDALVRCKCHIIVTMRAKTEYVMEKDERGKTTIKKMGLAPVQRDGVEYEFDVVADMDDAKLMVTKTRCPALKGAVINEPGEDFARQLRAWLTDGATPSPALPAPTPPALGPGQSATLLGQVVLSEEREPATSGRIEHRTEVERVTRAIGGTVESVTTDAAEDTLTQGQHKGKRAESLTDKALAEETALFESRLEQSDVREALAKGKPPKWYEAARHTLSVLHEETERRLRLAVPEPGANG